MPRQVPKSFENFRLITPGLFITNQKKFSITTQWRTQDFREEGAPTLKVGVPTYYVDQIFPKNCMIDPETGGASLTPRLDPPIQTSYQIRASSGVTCSNSTPIISLHQSIFTVKKLPSCTPNTFFPVTITSYP